MAVLLGQPRSGELPWGSSVSKLKQKQKETEQRTAEPRNAAGPMEDMYSSQPLEKQGSNLKDHIADSTSCISFSFVFHVHPTLQGVSRHETLLPISRIAHSTFSSVPVIELPDGTNIQGWEVLKHFLVKNKTGKD